jgi:hypothetical protein
VKKVHDLINIAMILTSTTFILCSFGKDKSKVLQYFAAVSDATPRSKEAFLPLVSLSLFLPSDNYVRLMNEGIQIRLMKKESLLSVQYRHVAVAVDSDSERV